MASAQSKSIHEVFPACHRSLGITTSTCHAPGFRPPVALVSVVLNWYLYGYPGWWHLASVVWKFRRLWKYSKKMPRGARMIRLAIGSLLLVFVSNLRATPATPV